MSDNHGEYPHFRLSFAQQQKRAKELLKAARSGNPESLARFNARPPRLAEAQHLIARDLRFANWAAMKVHIAAMSHEREQLAQSGNVLDADLPTLHVRCGSDIRPTLRRAGLHGDFLEHSYPYLIGPVREGPQSLEQRARFICESHAGDRDPPLTYEAALQGLQDDEQRLRESAGYARVVIWSEHDCYDQLVLLRLLGHYAVQPRPTHLELINVGAFPGRMRFLGLGQLPPEALRLLWARRQIATAAQLSLGLAGWKALASDDPRTLAALVRKGTPALPLLAPALHRHLRELPSTENGLGFTQQMAMAMLVEHPGSLNHIFGRMALGVDPLPGQGDAQVRDRVLPLGEVVEPLFTREPGMDRNGRARPPWTDLLTISEAGRAVLRGSKDLLSLSPPVRWVGGVQVGPGLPDWRWDESRREVIRRG